jgi:hypothetical protein
MSVLMERPSKELEANAIDAAKNDAESILRLWGFDAAQPQNKSMSPGDSVIDVCFSR